MKKLLYTPTNLNGLLIDMNAEEISQREKDILEAEQEKIIKEQEKITKEQEEVNRLAKIESAKVKLSALGLDEEEIKAIIGV